MYSISMLLWFSLMRELRNLGEARRESGAFLFVKKGSKRIHHFKPYTDFDPHAFDTGIINFSSNGQINLSEYCLEAGFQVALDVHTHPHLSTEQSYSDKQHPMINRKGYSAFIVPCYAQSRVQLYKGIGFYEYQGNFKWKRKRNLKISLI